MSRDCNILIWTLIISNHNGSDIIRVAAGEIASSPKRARASVKIPRENGGAAPAPRITRRGAL